MRERNLKMLTNILYKSKLAYWLYTKFSKHYSRAIDFLRRKLNDSIIAIDSIDPDYEYGDSEWRDYNSMRMLGITIDQLEALPEIDLVRNLETIDFVIDEIHKGRNPKCNLCYREIEWGVVK